MKSIPHYRRLTTAVFVASLIMPATSHAMTPDTGAPVSPFWTAPKILKEWFDWRSAAGWGTIGITNVIITAAGGESGGSITKAAFQFVCGTTASGIMAKITVPTEPTATNHIATVIKGASVVGPSVLCGWVSKWIYDSVLPPITSKIELKNLNLRNYPTTVQKIKDYGVAINTLLLVMEQNYRGAAVTAGRYRKALTYLQSNGCYLGDGTGRVRSDAFCPLYKRTYDQNLALAQDYTARLNENARSLKVAQNALNKIYFG